MFKNYLKLAWRNLIKRKIIQLLNILGLATGMAVCMLLTIYIQNEFGYDNFQENRTPIYRLAVERKYPGRTSYLGEIPQSIGQAVKLEFPEVWKSVSVIRAGKAVNVNEKDFEDEKIMGVDSNFFRVFTANFIQGDKNMSFQKPNTAVINESTAIRFIWLCAKCNG